MNMQARLARLETAGGLGAGALFVVHRDDAKTQEAVDSEIAAIRVSNPSGLVIVVHKVRAELLPDVVDGST